MKELDVESIASALDAPGPAPEPIAALRAIAARCQVLRPGDPAPDAVERGLRKFQAATRNEPSAVKHWARSWVGPNTHCRPFTQRVAAAGAIVLLAGGTASLAADVNVIAIAADIGSVARNVVSNIIPGEDGPAPVTEGSIGTITTTPTPMPSAVARATAAAASPTTTTTAGAAETPTPGSQDGGQRPGSVATVESAATTAASPEPPTPASPQSTPASGGSATPPVTTPESRSPTPTATPSPTSTVAVTPTPSPTATPGASSPTATPSPTAPAATYSAGAAGAVELAIVNGQLVVLGMTLNPGWTATESQATPTSFHVKFVNAGNEIEFEASIEGGTIRTQVSSGESG